MKNTNLLIGAGVVVAGYLFWKKSQSNSVTKSDVVTPKPSVSPTEATSGFSNEDIEKYAKQFSDEFVLGLDKVINDLTLQPIQPYVKTNDSKLDALGISLTEYRKQENLNRINGLKKLKNNYGDIYLTFKKSIPKFKNVTDLTYAKNLFIKGLNSNSVATKEEQIWMANNRNLGDNFGIDTSILKPETTKKQGGLGVATIGVGTILN